MKIVAFQTYHLEKFSPGKREAPYFDKLQETWRGWEAVSVLDGDDVLGICGWFIEGGTATVSMLLSDRLREKPLFLHRAVRRGIAWLERCGVIRIRATCHPDDDVGVSWLGRLGFAPSGNETRFLGVNYLEFVR